MIINYDLLEKALIFATNGHLGVRRKGDSRPYIFHPLEVCQLVTDDLKDILETEDCIYLQIVALLHDCVEDSQIPPVEDITIEIIEKEFGSRVAHGVKQMTLDKAKYDTLGKEGCLIDEMSHMDDDILDVKFRDRLSNVKDMKSMLTRKPDFVPYYVKQTRNIIHEVGKTREYTPTHLMAIMKIERELIKYDNILKSV